MKKEYKIKQFIDFLSGNPKNAPHIYVKIDKNKKYPTTALPARNEKLISAADGKAQVYISVNPCRPMTSKPKISDVILWTCEYIDLDVERPDHAIPATDKELADLPPQIKKINSWLRNHGFLTGYQDHTGNGYRWLLPIPLLNVGVMNSRDVLEINEHKKIWLKLLKEETGTNIDTAVGELSRITGVPGTLNFKGHKNDRIREPFRGCDRVEDRKLRDWIMSLEIPEEEIIDDTAIKRATIDIREFVEILADVDPALKTMLARAPTIKKGHRSDYDFAITRKLHALNVSESDCREILHDYGTIRCASVDYVKMTVRKVYIG